MSNNVFLELILDGKLVATLGGIQKNLGINKGCRWGGNGGNLIYGTLIPNNGSPREIMDVMEEYAEKAGLNGYKISYEVRR